MLQIQEWLGKEVYTLAIPQIQNSGSKYLYHIRMCRCTISEIGIRDEDISENNYQSLHSRISFRLRNQKTGGKLTAGLCEDGRILCNYRQVGIPIEAFTTKEQARAAAGKLKERAEGSYKNAIIEIDFDSFN